MKYKSFTLIEIILALVVSSIIASYVIKEKAFSNYLNEIKATQDALVNIVNNGIISNIGYASARGGECSTNYDFSNMTSTRLALCNEWNDNNAATLNDKFDITGDILSGKELMGSYGRCSFKTNVVSTNANQFDVFIDCSNVRYNSKTLKLLEESFAFVFESTLSAIFISIDHKAESIDDALPLDGDHSNIIDGKFRVRMGM